MPNIKSAKKRVKTIAKKKVLNNDKRASMRTAIKNVEKAVAAGDQKLAKESLSVAIKRIDKAHSHGIIHANNAARQKSRLTLKVNNIEK